MKKILSMREQVAIFCIIFAFTFGWFLNYGLGVFFNDDLPMNQKQAVPSMESIGFDLSMIIKGSQEFTEGRTAYTINSYSYPPLTIIAFIPFISWNYKFTYFLFFFMTIISYAVSLFLLDRVFRRKIFASVLLIFFLVTNFFSYGMQFELERGQYNVIAVTFAVLSLIFFSRNKKIVALFLITCAIQLKIYPALLLLLFLFADNKWRQNILFLLSTAAVNILLLFILGGQTFVEFFSALTTQMKVPYIWEGNHSLFSYCSEAIDITSFCTTQIYPYILFVYGTFLAFTIAVIWKLKLSTINPYLFGLAGLGLLLIPAASHDYTLALLPIIIFPYCKELYIKFIGEKQIENLIALTGTIFFYTGTLFSYNFVSPYFPYFENKAPILIVLILLIFLSFLQNVAFPEKQWFIRKLR